MPVRHGMHGKHEENVPSLRQLRRTCNNELYRTIKKMKVWIPEEKVREAEKLYLRMVVGRLQWIVEHKDNRRVLADWWDEAVGPEIAELWDVDPARLNRAFRDAFGG